MALSCLDGAPRWAGDVGAVRALGLVQVGAEGVASGALGALFSLVPLGGRLFRVALLSSLASGLAGLLLLRLIVGVRKSGPAPLHLLLALAASFLATLSSDWRLAGVAVGGPMLGMVLLLFSLRNGLRTGLNWVAQGALFGLCVTENHSLALCLAVALLARSAATQTLPTLNHLLGFLSSGVVVAVICLLPGLIEPLSAISSLNLGLSLGLPTEAAFTAHHSLLVEMGAYHCGLALLGAVSALWRPAQRELAAVGASLLLLDLMLPSSSVRLGAIAGLSVLSAHGAMFGVSWLRERHLPLGGLALRLLATVHLGILLLGAEEARQVIERRQVEATRTWTDEAFAKLPTGSMLLAQSPAVAWRLWAARVTQGLRPDVLLVPRALLAHGNLAEQLLDAEPKLAPLIRDVAMNGAAGEFALSHLADARPLKLELNPAWDHRLVAHLKPERVWLDFVPHAVGVSDRLVGLRSARKSARVVLRDARTVEGADWETLSRLRAGLYDQGFAMAALGDSVAGRLAIKTLAGVAPSSDQTRDLVERLKERNTGLTARLPLQ